MEDDTTRQRFEHVRLVSTSFDEHVISHREESKETVGKLLQSYRLAGHYAQTLNPSIPIVTTL